ncbi:hypothetical protein BSZ19_02650 [Bradyrhizobium japonicum]|uniref:Uncharacterized protein n=1 Tax=Bradyrhizobium japonicum TaxID=375 RepID=A0A1Y2JZV0_BRAJP|nr:hypothetical protein BSZ19_02650 [Bradyrhizobium japonicum]
MSLGPIGKSVVVQRLLAGESVTEYTSDGIEVRSSAGTDKTINEQCEYFERTKEPGNTIEISNVSRLIDARLANGML